MGQPDNPYLIATSGARSLEIDLPAGAWTVRRIDALAKTSEVVSEDAQGSVEVTTADSVAGLLHLDRR